MRSTRGRRSVLLANAAMVGTLLAGCAGGSSGPTSGAGATASTAGLPTGVPVTDASRLCDLLGPGDLVAAGVAGAGAATVSSDGPGSAYCVYAGQSAATGGIEFDAFVDDDPTGTFDVILSESPAELDPVDVPGADAAVGSDGVAGSVDGYATVVVRKGNLVFTIAARGGAGKAAALAALSTLVLARASALADLIGRTAAARDPGVS